LKSKIFLIGKLTIGVDKGPGMGQVLAFLLILFDAWEIPIPRSQISIPD